VKLEKIEGKEVFIRVRTMNGKDGLKSYAKAAMFSET